MSKTNKLKGTHVRVVREAWGATAPRSRKKARPSQPPHGALYHRPFNPPGDLSTGLTEKLLAALFESGEERQEAMWQVERMFGPFAGQQGSSKQTPADVEQDNDAGWAIWSDLWHLFHSATKRGSQGAAESLASLTLQAVELLNIVAAIRPQLLSPWARKEVLWPFWTGLDPSWPRRALRASKHVELGTDTFHGRLKGKAYATGWPARAWALAIVETLEDNRVHVARNLCALPPDHLQTIPDWAKHSAALPPFNPDKPTVKQWARVGREMLRAEHSDFSTRPEWNAYAKRWEGMPAKEKAGRILDLIESAMERLPKRI